FFLKDLPTERMIQSYANKIVELSPNKTREALQMLRNASILMRKLERYFAKYELSQTQFLVLIILFVRICR
ncbi:MAG: MarR family transcriptional regulator, partial [Bacteroidia bacterium]